MFNAFSKDHARDIAAGYADIGFIKKPNVILGLFYIVVSVLSIVVIAATAKGGTINGLEVTWIDMAVGIAMYLFLAIFIFFNHRWAMIAACVIYLLDKAIYLASGGFSFGQIIFGFICVSLTWRAVLVATALKKRVEDNISAFD